MVSGIDAASLASVQAFYDGLVQATVAVGRTQEAELVKLIENTYRHVNVALVNELAMFTSDLGIDIWESLARPGRSRSDSPASTRDRASAGTVFRLIRAICRGR